MDPQGLTAYPPLSVIERIIVKEKRGNCVPVYVELPADLLTPCMAYLKIAKDSKYSFILESVLAGENIARYSFIGSDPFKVIRTGPGDLEGDPMVHLQRELSHYKYVKLPEIPSFTGGAVGYVSYDCVQYFEPKTKRPLEDSINIPESLFMLCDLVVIYDHLYQNIKIVSHIFSPTASADLANLSFIYSTAVSKLRRVAKLLVTGPTPSVPQPPVTLGATATSNVGKEGYERFVTELKKNIIAGDIIQAVPSQRLSRPTALHPFNAYRQLRQVNPSPYMYYLDCGDFQIVGASPETLCKVTQNKVYNHAIAGTTRRGKTAAEDVELGKALLASTKDRAEHIMLVDLARNDVNRVCEPSSVKVDELMALQKFSHVFHLTSTITGQLREDKTRFDAFRSIFPAGTVSGAPKIKAIELVFDLEKERRGVYAGAVGRWDFASDEMDTAIAIRTMVFKDGVVYFQAGGGIVYDSVEEDEYIETINKLGANVKAIDEAETCNEAKELTVIGQAFAIKM